MKDKVRVRLYVPPSLQTHEVRIPFCLRVDQALSLVSRLLSSEWEHAGGPFAHPLLMLVEGDAAGLVVKGDDLVGDLFRRGVLYDGALAAIV